MRVIIIGSVAGGYSVLLFFLKPAPRPGLSLEFFEISYKEM